MQNLKIGYPSAGFVTDFHVRGLPSVRGVEVAGIINRSGAEDIAKLSHNLGVGSPVIYNSLEQMLPNIDVLVCTVPNFARIAFMQELVAASQKTGYKLKGLACEKPLARTVAEAREMVRLAKILGIPLAYMENQRFMPGILAMMGQIADVQKKNGPVMMVSGGEEHPGPHKGWFWDPIRQGGGTLSDMGCHTKLVTEYMLTPLGKPFPYLTPLSVVGDVKLLKWGQPYWRKQLLDEHGVDYAETPAEDYANFTIEYRDPETGLCGITNCTNSWMFQEGLRLSMHATGPNYTFSENTLTSPAHIFIADAARVGVGDKEMAQEKATASTGHVPVILEEPAAYGYVNEYRDMAAAFGKGTDATLGWDVGVHATWLVMAAYMAAERGVKLDLTNQAVKDSLETYVPAIARGEGAAQLYR